MNPREDLKAYLDQELPPERQAEVAREIERDPALAAEAESFRRIAEAVRQEIRFPEPTGMAKTVAKMAKAPTPAWRRPSRLAWAGAALTLVLAVLVAPSMINDGRPLTAAKRVAPEASMAITMESAKARVSQDAATAPSAAAPVNPVPNRARMAPEEFAGSVGRSISPSITRSALIARTADLAVVVPNVPRAVEQAVSTAQRLGGYVAASESYGDGHGAVANLTVRVPAAQFEEARRSLASLGRLVREQLGSEDVTTQVADTEARLAAMRAEERQYLEIMKTARRVQDVLAVRDRLAGVRQEIESLDAIRKSLRSRAAESTITLSLSSEPPAVKAVPPKGWLTQTWDGARDLLSALGRTVAAGLIYVVVLIPVRFPLLLAGWWLNRRGR